MVVTTSGFLGADGPYRSKWQVALERWLVPILVLAAMNAEVAGKLGKA